MVLLYFFFITYDFELFCSLTISNTLNDNDIHYFYLVKITPFYFHRLYINIYYMFNNGFKLTLAYSTPNK